MSLTERGLSLVKKVEGLSGQPLIVRASLAERLVREVAEIIAELSILAETLLADSVRMRARLEKLEAAHQAKPDA